MQYVKADFFTRFFIVEERNNMRYLLNAEQMKSADSHTIQDLGIPSRTLMERAAGACVNYIEEQNWPAAYVCIVCGSGNNGGDGFAIGRILREQGYPVTAVFAGRMESRTEECIYQMEKFEQCGGVILTEWKDDDYTVIIDALFGVGLNREITGHYLELIRSMNCASGKKLAVDIPSGISASDGRVFGEAFRADATVTFQERKLGLVLYPGTLYTGDLSIADIGIDSEIVTGQLDTAYALEMHDAAKLLPERPEYAHKGTFGKLLLIAGSSGMAGAAFLSAYAAYRTGAGLVRIYTSEDNRCILQHLIPEAIITTYKEYEEESLIAALDWADVVCMGSGLGMSEVSVQIVDTVLRKVEVPCVIDADGINILASHQEWKERLKNKNYVLTPHLKELSRLTGLKVSEIQEHRREILDQVTASLGVTLVQKDARTFVGADGRQMCVNLMGNAAMAKAGSGDVLAGVIAGLMAQGKESYDAAILGVYLHGLAGDIARNELGCYSVLARDLADKVGSAIQMTENWKAEK